MTTTSIANVSVTTQANVYFDGKCVSHGLTDGLRFVADVDHIGAALGIEMG